MLNTNYQATDPMKLLKDKCDQGLLINDADIRAAGQALLNQDVAQQANNKSRSVELRLELLEAVSGLMAIDVVKAKPLTFDSMIKALRNGRGSTDD